MFNGLLLGFASLIRAARAMVILLALWIFISFLSGFVEDLPQYPLLYRVAKTEAAFDAPAIEIIHKTVPHTYEGRDYSRLILLVLVLIVANILGNLGERAKRVRRQQVLQMEYDSWRQEHRSNLSEAQLSAVDSKFKKLGTASGAKDHKKLLAEFIQLKEQLDNMGQQLAFLAMDVVDSTGMKRDEDKHIASYDFDRYNELVRECLDTNGVVKYAMTPDGIMSCFRTVDDAVNAAKCILTRLVTFNRDERKMKRAFQVRFGVNAGFVYIDNDTPLEQVSDRVIDIAGHMQKHAKPDTINIAASAIEPLKSRGGFAETTDVIDEQRVYVWGKDGGLQ